MYEDAGLPGNEMYREAGNGGEGGDMGAYALDSGENDDGAALLGWPAEGRRNAGKEKDRSVAGRPQRRPSIR